MKKILEYDYIYINKYEIDKLEKIKNIILKYVGYIKYDEYYEFIYDYNIIKDIYDMNLRCNIIFKEENNYLVFKFNENYDIKIK